MKHISAADISARVADLCVRACTVLPPDVVAALEAARDREESQLGREVLSRLLDNARIAQEDGVPMCQDTGLAVVFVEIGEDVRVTGGHLYDAITDGVRQGYEKGYLRKSVVYSPLDRRNTGDNTPPIIHAQIVPGDTLKIAVAAKGAGSENMSRLDMMAPADGEAAVKRFVRETVEQAGASACPPVVVGVGLGGSFEQCALIAKKALLRPLSDSSANPEVARLEQELLDAVNRTGIGPMAVGGRTTALAVKVETAPCHIASMPVAVNLQCHAARHAEHTWE
ncbi:MAG TPA: fumarate hydratase [Armatimonadota bacterium]|nr:fumarate hydratase [Armatimonadota bacterium]